MLNLGTVDTQLLLTPLVTVCLGNLLIVVKCVQDLHYLSRLEPDQYILQMSPNFTNFTTYNFTRPIETRCLSNCDVAVFGLKVSTYCNLLEKIFLSQMRDALKESLPLSSPRAMRQIERAIYKRFGNEIYIPLYIDDQRPVESFLLTADNVVNVGKKLSDDIMRLVEQMNAVEDTIMNFY